MITVLHHEGDPTIFVFGSEPLPKYLQELLMNYDVESAGPLDEACSAYELRFDGYRSDEARVLAGAIRQTLRQYRQTREVSIESAGKLGEDELRELLQKFRLV